MSVWWLSQRRLVFNSPEGCSSPVAGRIVCNIGTVPAQEVATFYNPRSWLPRLTQRIVFTATMTERENDFDPQPTPDLHHGSRPLPRVTLTANDGTGSLRPSRHLDANANCVDHALQDRLRVGGRRQYWKTFESPTARQSRRPVTLSTAPRRRSPATRTATDLNRDQRRRNG